MAQRIDQPDADHLPAATAIMVVDAERFSGHTDAQQEQLAELIPDVLADAFQRAALPHVWDERQFPDPTGDGFIIGFPINHLPPVIDNLLPALQEELRDRSRTLRGLGMRLRLRLSLNAGPAKPLDDDNGSPVGDAMIETHRLLDSEPVRRLLTASDPETTFLAVIVSELVLDWSVGQGGRTTTRPSQFCQVPVSIAKKNFSAMAYLRVPEPSGELLERGLLGVQPDREDEAAEPPAPSAEPPPPSATAISGVHNSTVVGGVSGDGNLLAGDSITITGRGDRR